MPRPPSIFVFDLQAVLDQRERTEQEHQRRVASIERERVAIEDRLRGLQQRIIEAKDDLRAGLRPLPEGRGVGEGPSAPLPGHGRPAPVADIRRHAALSSALLAQAERAVLELAGVHKRLELARRELVAASAARKAVDLLRTRRYESWKREVARAENAELDELAVMRFGRGGDAP